MATPAKPVLTLAVIAAVLTALVALVASFTRERIASNEQAWIRQRLDALVPPATHDNDLLADSISVTAPDLLGSAQPVKIYRARRAGAPVAAVLRPIAPDGYRGPIELLVAIGQDGRLIGVQVIRHQETPGLGDAFESRDVHWLDRFRGRSLTDPPPPRWTVRRDGGDFDAFTGATITPRAIVKAVRNALEYYQRNSQRIFEQPTQ
ncbi:MAG TPA: electron transport complex subunit RsxG [Steroidobacteraceae bacterium]|jgi:H+/Na+-translocating ferredoxin:NAD+ oxidoreductase subunit G|nr:electron transport complex subunit RsxG [Steroidobacteraceae bacterium]